MKLKLNIILSALFVARQTFGATVVPHPSGETSIWESGSAAMFASGSTLTINGNVTGAPTGGTLDLGNVTVTLGSASVVNNNLVTLADNQTLTSKTLTSPRITGDLIASGPTDVIYADTIVINQTDLSGDSGIYFGWTALGNNLTFRGGSEEMILSSHGRIAIVPDQAFWGIGFIQLGNTGPTSEVIWIASEGAATANMTTVPSHRFSLSGAYWNGSASVGRPAVLQSIPDSSGNATFEVYVPGVTTAGTLNGTTGRYDYSSGTRALALNSNSLELWSAGAVDATKWGYLAGATAAGGALMTAGNVTQQMALLPAATDAAAGKVELATTAEALAGTDTERAVTPAGLAAAIGLNTAQSVAYNAYGQAYGVNGGPANGWTYGMVGIQLRDNQNDFVGFPIPNYFGTSITVKCTWYRGSGGSTGIRDFVYQLVCYANQLALGTVENASNTPDAAQTVSIPWNGSNFGILVTSRTFAIPAGTVASPRMLKVMRLGSDAAETLDATIHLQHVEIINNGTGTNLLAPAAPPGVALVSPSAGTTAGGTRVMIYGSSFTGANNVTFGGAAAPSFIVNSDTSITATTPGQNAGLVDVAVAAPFATGSGTNLFRYAIVTSTTDTDGDGLNDAAELHLGALGFDLSSAQPALVSSFLAGSALFTDGQYNTNYTEGQNAVINSPNTFGLYTLSQVQALNVGVPLLQRDGLGQFKLTIGIEKSTTLLPGSFRPFPLTAPQTTINAAGKLEFLFTVPDNAAFFRLQSQ